MFKMIMTTKRRADFSPEDFKKYYDATHMPLVMSLASHDGPKPTAFRRNFIKHDDPLLSSIGDGRADLNPPFDCIVEIEFERREDAEKAMKNFFTPNYLDKVKADEKNFVDPTSIHYYVVEVA